jgi:hypothetical protein
MRPSPLTIMASVAAEARRLSRLIGPEAGTHDVRFTQAD